MALGALRADVLQLVARSAACSVGLGATVGVVLSLLLLRVLNHVVEGANRTDAPALLVSLVVLAFVALLASGIPHEVIIALNLPVLVFSVLVSVATGIVAGLMPALQLSRTNLAETVQASASRTLAVGGSRTRTVLISGQIALTVLLMAASGAAMRNFTAAYRASLGFDPHNLLHNPAAGGSAHSLDDGRGVAGGHAPEHQPERIAYRWTKSSMANGLVLSGVAGLLLIVASVASLLTARRAMQIDPADALRSE